MNDVVDSTDPAYFLLDGAFFQGQDRQELTRYTKVLLEHPSNTLILSLLYESVAPCDWVEDFKNLLQQLRSKNPNRKIFIVLDEWYHTFNWDSIRQLADDIYFLDFLLVRSWLFYCHYQLVPTNQDWNADSKEFLFLLGKPGKFNRIRLLYKLYQARLTGKCAWSLTELDGWHLQGIKCVLPELNHQELDKFLKTHTKTLDRVYRGHDYTKVMPDVQEFVNLPKFNSFAFLSHDVRIYQDKLFAVIAETDFDRTGVHTRITEKTWNHIIQRLPFIIAGETFTLQKLTDLGFDTFQDLLPIQNYDNPRLENYLEPTTLQDWFNHWAWQKDFIEYYNVVKDPQWPDLDTIKKNFDQYHHIVEECSASYQTPVVTDIEQRLNAVVSNVQSWSNENRLSSDIKSRIEKNYQTFNTLGQRKYAEYQSWTRQHKIESCNLDIIFFAHFSETPNHEISTWLNTHAS